MSQLCGATNTTTNIALDTTAANDHMQQQDAAVARCWELPPGTFGAAYAGFMGSRGFHADDRPPVRAGWRSKRGGGGRARAPGGSAGTQDGDARRVES